MSRPSSSHDGERYEEDPFDPSGFSLPLFNPHQTTIPPYRSGQLDGQVHPPPPSSSGHQHRHSVNYGSNLNSEFNSSAAAPHTAGLPQSQHRQHQSMASTLPYSTLPYPQTATGAQHVDELMPPASTSASFGSLARSASLGARKKDPYSYSSDDVESGLGNVEVRGESSNGWPGYGGGRQAAQVHAPPPQSRDIPMSPTKSYGNNNQMNPPPIPAYALTRPPPARNDSGRSSPSRATYTHEASYSMPSPYVPRGSDPGPSTLAGQTQWAEYRRPQSNQRVPSAGMYQSSPTEQLSAFLKPDTLGASPQSPLLNPYDVSRNMAPAQTISPNPSAQSRWGRSQIPTSPRRGHRSHSSHQLYPASQPVTPASKTYGMGPPRATMPSRERSRSGISRQGLTEVKAWKDLVPMVTNESNGRRADPDLPGKYLSVSLPGISQAQKLTGFQPLKCLTAALPQTFTLCNPQFRYETSENPRRVLTKPSKPAHNDGADNDDWDYILYVNDVLGGEQGGDR
jgi:hypothetical protein